MPRYALDWCRHVALYQSGILDFDGSLSEQRVPLAVGVIDMDWHKTARFLLALEVVGLKLVDGRFDS